MRRIGQEEQEKLSAVLETLPGGVADWREQMAGSAELMPAEWLRAGKAIRHIVTSRTTGSQRVPFDILPAGEGQFLIERADISYLPSAILLRRPAPNGTGILPPWSQQLVAFGDPVVPTAGQQAINALDASPAPFLIPRKKSGRLQRRPPAVRAVSGTSGPQEHISRWKGEQRSASSRQHSRGCRRLQPGRFASLVLARRSCEWRGRLVVPARVLRSEPEQRQNGRALGLRYGKRKAGAREGVQAFSRALLAAGSRSSLTTLWRVDDRATAEFMKQFYHFAVERRMGKAEALRQVKLKFLQSHSAYESPRYWAAFVISGDALTSVPAVRSWRELFLGIASRLLLAPWSDYGAVAGATGRTTRELSFPSSPEHLYRDRGRDVNLSAGCCRSKKFLHIADHTTARRQRDRLRRQLRAGLR